jgi:hypothetical protein
MVAFEGAAAALRDDAPLRRRLLGV